MIREEPRQTHLHLRLRARTQALLDAHSIRFIPGVNDDEENLRASGAFLASLPNLEGVELMGYHDIAQAKYQALGWEYKLPEARPPAKEALSRAADLLKTCGISVLD